MTCPRRVDIGVYVLGALAPEERSSVHGHLAGCEHCAEEFRQLSGLPGLLARAPEPVLDDVLAARLAPPPQLLTSLMAARRRRGHRQLVAAVAAALVLLGGGTALGVSLARPAAVTGPVTRTIELRTAADVTGGEAGLSARPWGTAIALRCREAGTASTTGPRTLYTLVVRSPDGSLHPVARWSPPPGQDVDVQAATDLAPTQVAGLEVRTGDGEVVLRS